MKFNLAETSRIYVESGPHKVISEFDLAVFSDQDTTVSGIEIFTGETLSIICDLSARYSLDTVSYYRTAATTETVSIFGRQGPDDVWSTIAVTDSGTTLSGNLGSLDNKYKSIRVTHAVTAGSARAFELEVFTDDQEVLFGLSGNNTKFGIDAGTEQLTTESIPIFNPDDIPHDFFQLLDGGDVDSSGLLMATTSGGPFFGLYESGISVPDDFPFSSGSFDNTVESAGTVVLVSGVAGFYYTPVIDVALIDGRRLFWEATVTGTNEIDEFVSIDSEPTIGVRFSDTAPIDGGWVSGQISTDSNWHVTTGALVFVPVVNNTILEPRYQRYFQARLEFTGPGGGLTPILKGVGIEEGLKLSINPGENKPIFVKSTFTTQLPSQETALISWYFESRNSEQ